MSVGAESCKLVAWYSPMSSVCEHTRTQSFPGALPDSTLLLCMFLFGGHIVQISSGCTWFTQPVFRGSSKWCSLYSATASSSAGADISAVCAIWAEVAAPAVAGELAVA